MPVQEQQAVYCFADCELDPRERRLRVRGETVTLTPKVFDTLVLLVARAGHVVNKDELMTALWPRGFVHESNLTKHIWLIRRALGDGEGEGRYIETVPKLGYRFVAPVQRVAAEELSVKDSESMAAPLTSYIAAQASTQDVDRQVHIDHPGRATDSRDAIVSAPAPRRRWAIAVTAALSILIAGGAWFAWRASYPVRPTIAPDPGAVAIVDFNNLSGNAKDAWLGPALEQMLATEVAASGKLHAVAEELVRPAREDLPSPDAGGYAPASLSRLQRRLGAHYVLSGAYLVSGDADAPQLRVDLIVQDTQTGAAFASFSRDAPVNELPRLVAQAGSELRNRFGAGSSDPATLKQLAAAQPPTSEVARRIGFALQALSQYDPARARDELLQAIAQSPGYAPAYMYLARAWSALGYRAKAIAAASQAAQNSADLSREEQLQIRAQQAALDGERAQAAALWGDLADLRPSDPEYRLQWVAALTAAAKYADAQTALAQARKLPALASDPRLELAASELEAARGNGNAAVPHARAALAQARQRGEAGLAAEAELQLGTALDEDAQAEPTLRQAAADFRRIGNPHGEAHAWQNLGNLQSARNQIAAARESYQRAMTIYQGIGDLGGEAAIYDNLSDMLWSAGDRDGAEAALRQALAIARETNDPVRKAWTLTGLATVLSDESASDEAAAMYREAIALDSQAGERAHLAYALSNYADLLRMRGKLDEARAVCSQAQAADQALQAASHNFAADFECAQIALDRGEADSAYATFEAIENQAVAAKDDFMIANTQLLQGQIAMGRGQWSVAQTVLQKSLRSWTDQREAAGEATVSALLALCADALHDTRVRDSAAAHARDLRGRVTQRAEVFELDVALAELQAASGEREQAMASLRTLADDAVKRQWPGLAFEARLAILRVLQRGNDAATIKTWRDALAADAHQAGYGWVGERVAMR